MKIGLVCPYSMAHGGGVKEFVLAQRTELEKRGYDVRIITPQPKNIDGIDTKGFIFVGTATDFRSPLGTTSTTSSSFDNEALAQMLEAENFDIMHFHEPWVPFLSRQILTRSNSINIGTFHANVPQNIVGQTIVKVVTPYTKSALKYLHALTATGPAAAEYVSTLTDRNIVIVPLSVDLKLYRKPKSRTSAAGTQILYIGRLERRKGVRYLLRAYQLLQELEPDVELVIAGNGPERNMLEQLAEELELRNLTFLGFVEDEEKHRLLDEADLFVSPAIYGEGFGIVLLEALAKGLVTVAGDNIGYASALKELGAISLVDSRNSADFARRMQLLLKEPKLRAAWQSWALTYVKQFSYEHVVDQYIDVYKAALKEHGRKVKV